MFPFTNFKDQTSQILRILRKKVYESIIESPFLQHDVAKQVSVIVFEFYHSSSVLSIL